MGKVFSEKEQSILESSKEAYSLGLRRIRGFFEKGERVQPREDDTSSLYRAVGLLCDRKRIPVVDYGTLLTACGSWHRIEDIARLSHFPCRKIVLEDQWTKKDGGDFIAFRKTDENTQEAVVCVRKGGTGKYSWYEADGTFHRRLSQEDAASFLDIGYMIYRPFPNEAINIRGLIRFGLRSIRKSDVITFCIMGILGTLIGMILPLLNSLIYDFYISLGEVTAILEICLLILVANLAGLCFGIAKNIAFMRTGNVAKYDIQAAVYDRLFNLPDSKIREFESADLGMRASSIGNVVEGFLGVIVGAVFSVALGLGYVIMMLTYSGRLSFWGLSLLAVAVMAIVPLLLRQRKYLRMMLKTKGELSSTAYQLITGVERVKTSGAENKAVLRYLTPYIDMRDTSTKGDRCAQIIMILQTVFTSLFTLVLYGVVGTGRTSFTTGQFLGFISAFGAFSAAVFSLLTAFSQAASIRPLLDRSLPVLQTPPDYSAVGMIPAQIDGNVEVSHVSFFYSKDMPPALDDISFHVKAGEYVGIAGPSGCGKSTLIRLLLAMESPSNGKIYYDDHDLQKLDKREMRKRLGVVLQNGRVFSGSILENITCSAPGATIDDAMEAVRAVGLENDIKAMPMGLHTRMAEGGGTVSGGQQQRILIARAIIGKPKLILLDEATSALDNEAQSMVCSSLEKLNATRIVVAHRLSTIRDCDRILVFEQGKIVEEGNYEELMLKKGLFYRMSKRQIAQ